MPSENAPGTSRPLPDRAIYRSTSLVAYLASIFAHAWDECVEFWRTDWRALSVGIIFPGLGLLFSYFVRGETATVTDAQAILITTALPLAAVAATLYFWGVVKAPYAIHCRLHKRLAAEEGRGTLADRLRLLSAEIGQFSVYRDGVPLGVEFKDSKYGPVLALAEHARRQTEGLAKRDYETSAIYAETFAGRVISALGEIRQALPDAHIEIYQQPESTAGMRAVAKWLLDMAERLPR